MVFGKMVHVVFRRLKEALENKASFSEIYEICKQYREYGIDSNLIYDYLYFAISNKGYSPDHKEIVCELLSSLSGRCNSGLSLEGAGVVNIYLDDLRDTPDSFIRTYTPSETITLLGQFKHVGILSLDHDLGDDRGIGTGYDVVNWVEEQVFTNDSYIAPRQIMIHSDNSSGAFKMKLGLQNISRKIGRRISPWG